MLILCWRRVNCFHTHDSCSVSPARTQSLRSDPMRSALPTQLLQLSLRLRLPLRRRPIVPFDRELRNLCSVYCTVLMYSTYATTTLNYSSESPASPLPLHADLQRSNPRRSRAGGSRRVDCFSSLPLPPRCTRSFSSVDSTHSLQVCVCAVLSGARQPRASQLRLAKRVFAICSRAAARVRKPRLAAAAARLSTRQPTRCFEMNTVL